MDDSVIEQAFCLQCEGVVPEDHEMQNPGHQVVQFLTFDSDEQIIERWNANTEPRDDLDPEEPPEHVMFGGDLWSMNYLTGSTWQVLDSQSDGPAS